MIPAYCRTRAHRWLHSSSARPRCWASLLRPSPLCRYSARPACSGCGRARRRRAARRARLRLRAGPVPHRRQLGLCQPARFRRHAGAARRPRHLAFLRLSRAVPRPGGLSASALRRAGRGEATAADPGPVGTHGVAARLGFHRLSLAYPGLFAGRLTARRLRSAHRGIRFVLARSAVRRSAARARAQAAAHCGAGCARTRPGLGLRPRAVE